MSFISKFFGNLFKKDNSPKKLESISNPTVIKLQLTPAEVNNYRDRWEKERLERIVAAEGKLKDWIIVSVRTRGSLAFSWESGNDEAFVTFKDYDEASKENFQELEDYVIDKLNIPDAGEFQMNGQGTIYIADGLVKTSYSSIMKELLDYDEETQTEVYSEEEQDSGDKVLFGI